MNDVFRVSASSDANSAAFSRLAVPDLHAPLDPNDTIVPPRLEHLPIDAR